MMRYAARQSLLFALSCALAGAGFLVESIPFAVAYLPFAIALVAAPLFSTPRLAVLALMTGHFLWPALISGWGLVQLGIHPLAVVTGGIATLMLVSASVAWLGIGLSALLLAALPFFPANPLLVTGSILPGIGLVSLIALPFCVTLIEIQRGTVTRAVVLAALLILPRFAMPWANQPAQDESRTAAYEEINISGDVALTELRHWVRIMAHVEDGDHIILGENIFRHDDHGAIFWWCHMAREREVTAMIGVLGPTGLDEVWRFDAETCPEPQSVYRAVLGIPMINGGWWSQDTHVARIAGADKPLPEPHWLICFEAFSLWRWVGLGLEMSRHDTPRPVVILANDYWTAPFSTALSRRKVAGQFAALFGVEVFHADRGRTVLRGAERSS